MHLSVSANTTLGSICHLDYDRPLSLVTPSILGTPPRPPQIVEPRKRLIPRCPRMRAHRRGASGVVRQARCVRYLCSRGRYLCHEGPLIGREKREAKNAVSQMFSRLRCSVFIVTLEPKIFPSRPSCSFMMEFGSLAKQRA
jgi:hypothetical protein